MSEMHLVLDSDIRGPWPQGTEVVYFGMGCFWGAEKKLWTIPGVVSTAVGYMGGTASDPTYPLVCTGSTGHSEIVLVAYDPAKTSVYNLLKCFWENHDPTQGNRQGNDIGTQYRSAVYWTNSGQEDLVRQTRDAYNAVLVSKGFDPITRTFGFRVSGINITSTLVATATNKLAKNGHSNPPVVSAR